MNIGFSSENNTLYIHMKGELDDCASNYARSIIDENLKNCTFKNVVFDMSDLKFMDSTGIGVLIGRYKYLKNRNINTYIANTSGTIEKIFKMSGIFEIMPKIS